MGVFDRMGRVISANFNSLLDSVEDPAKSLDVTLQEMGEQIRAARGEVVKNVAAEKQLRNKTEELGKEIEKWERRAELAISHGDDELARSALQQKRRVSAERDRAEQLRAEQRGLALEMKAEVERMDTKLEELRGRRGTLVANAQQAKAGGVEGLGARAPGGGAFSEFRRMEAEIEGVEAAISAQREIEVALGPARGPGGMTTDEVEAKFRMLEHGGAEVRGGGDDVDEELLALKKRVRVQT